MTIPNVILGQDIAPSWGNAVADQLNSKPLAISSVTGMSVPDSSNTAVAGLSDVYDPNSWATSGGIKPDVAGYYLVTVNTEWSSMSAGSRILHNVFAGSPVIAGTDDEAGPGSPNKSMAGVGYLDGSSDSVNVQVFHSGGSGKTVDLRLSVFLLVAA